MASATSSPAPAPRRWGKRLLKVLAVLAITEVALRVLVFFWVRWAEPPHCGLQPEILHRLFTAYGCCGIDPTTMVPDPHRGYRHAADVTDRTDSGALFSTNSRGARGRREYALPKPAATRRIVALGDSFTFGQGVPDDATWPAQLERALANTEVVNLGERGYGHDQMLYALRDDGIPLQPDAVVLAFYDADRVRNELTFYCFEKPRLSATPDGWQVENQPVPSPAEVRRRYLLLPLLYVVPRALYEVVRDPSILQESRGDPARATEIIRRMRQLAEESGARFIIVNLPEHPEQPPAESGFFYDYCARTGAECVDPWPDFRVAAGTSDPTVLRERYYLPGGDMHYSAAGYAVVADALRRHLTERPLASPNR